MATASVPISDVLSAPNLTGLVQLTAQGIPQVKPASFTRIRHQVNRDYAEWKTAHGARGVAQQTAYGAPAKDDQQTDLGYQTAKCLHSFRTVRLPITDFMNLLQVDNLQKQKMGRDEVARQVKFHTQRNLNLRTAAADSALFQGNIWIDKQGNMLPSATNSVVTIPSLIPAGNQGQLNVFGTGNILTNGWQNPAETSIAQQIINLRIASVRLTGYPITHAFYGANVANYLINNTALSTYFSRAAFPTPLYSSGVGPHVLSSGDLPANLLSLNWIPGYMEYYLDSTGTPQTLLGPDEVVFTCDPDAVDFWQPMEGSYPVPNDYGPTSVDDVISAYDEKFGMAAWAKPCNNPSTAELFFVDTFLPTVTIPNCIFQSVVNFGS